MATTNPLERYLVQFPILMLRNVIRNTIAAIERADIPELLSDPLVEELRRVDQLLFEAINRKRKSGMGTYVLDCDEDRKNRLRKFRQGAESVADPNRGGDKGGAADAILKALDNVGPVYGLRYGERTELIDKIIADLSTTKMRAIIEIAGLQEQFDALKESQKTFVSAVYNQQDADSALRQTTPPGKLKPVALNAMRNFLKLLYARREDPLWCDLYNDVLESTDAARASLKLPKKKKEEENK